MSDERKVYLVFGNDDIDRFKWLETVYETEELARRHAEIMTREFDDPNVVFEVVRAHIHTELQVIGHDGLLIEDE